MTVPHLVTVDELGAATIIPVCEGVEFECTLLATAVAAFTEVSLLTAPIPAGLYLCTVGDDGNVERWARA